MNMNNKKNLREKSKTIRKTLDINSISAAITTNIKKTEVYQNAKSVMIFYPLKDEINLLELLDDKKLFFLPRVNKTLLECCPYQKGDLLSISEFGVKEPLTQAVDKNNIDLVFVPALCIDKNCNRLGYGKGFYDRFLSDYQGTSIIPIPSALVFSNICTEKHDVCCSKFITELST